MSENQIDDIKKIIKLKKSDSSELDIDLAVDEAIEEIKSYCNIEEVPTVLKFTVINMAIDIIDLETYTRGEKVKSIARGDTNITYADEKKSEKSDVLRSYSKKLNQYKKIRWA